MELPAAEHAAHQGHRQVVRLVREHRLGHPSPFQLVQKQRQRDPSAGYARDFVSLMREILPDCVERDIKVLSNAGGVNVEGCAAAIKETAREL